MWLHNLSSRFYNAHSCKSFDKIIIYVRTLAHTEILLTALNKALGMATAASVKYFFLSELAFVVFISENSICDEKTTDTLDDMLPEIFGVQV